MATGGEEPIVDQDQDGKVPDSFDDDKDQGVGKRKRNPATGILRIDTAAANGSPQQRTTRRKSSSSSVDYRFAASLNPVGVGFPQFFFLLFFF